MAEPDVNTPVAAYHEMATRWALPKTLLGGTLAMQAAGETYLPKMPKETQPSYNVRLKGSVLFNGYGRTVRVLSGKPFVKPVVLEQGSDSVFEEMAADVDLAGTDLTGFSRDCLKDLLNYGKTHILVDYPATGGTLNLGEERTQGIRPYFVRICPDDLIGWRGMRVGGREVLAQVRIRETATEGAGDFGSQQVKRVRVIYPDRFEIYRERDAGHPSGPGYYLEGTLPNTLGKVALVTVYAIRTGFLISAPPLEDLAFLNLRHWQSDSDQTNILHVARVPLLAFLGFSEEDFAAVEIGPSRAIRTSNADADVKFVEHTGAAINAGKESLAGLEEKMASMGADLLVRRQGNETATGRGIDARENESDLQAMVRNLEAGLQQAFGYAGEWLKKPNAKAEVKIYQEFGLSLADATELQSLQAARQNRDISQRVYLEELRRRGVLGDQIDIDEIIAETQTDDPFAADPALSGGTDG